MPIAPQRFNAHASFAVHMDHVVRVHHEGRMVHTMPVIANQIPIPGLDQGEWVAWIIPPPHLLHVVTGRERIIGNVDKPPSMEQIHDKLPALALDIVPLEEGIQQGTEVGECLSTHYVLRGMFGYPLVLIYLFFGIMELNVNPSKTKSTDAVRKSVTVCCTE